MLSSIDIYVNFPVIAPHISVAVRLQSFFSSEYQVYLKLSFLSKDVVILVGIPPCFTSG